MTGPVQQEQGRTPTRVDSRELGDNLATFLQRVQDGAAFLITSEDQVVAELHPPTLQERPQRRPGALRGRIVMAPDFDEMPADLLDIMENGKV